jgi:hypothetical protein
LFEDIDLTGVGCRRNYMEVRISAVDRFVSSTWGYGKEVGRYRQQIIKDLIDVEIPHTSRRWCSGSNREFTVKRSEMISCQPGAV